MAEDRKAEAVRELGRAVLFAVEVLGIVTGIWGLSTSPEENGLAKFAWLAISLVVLVVPLYLLAPKLFKLTAEAVFRYRNYQALLDSVADSDEKLTRANERLASIPQQLEDSRLMGQGEAVGALTAMNSKANLRLVAARADGENLVLYARVTSGDVPLSGSRFLVRSDSELQTRRGILAVVGPDRDGRLELAVVERQAGSSAFWKAAVDRAATGDAAPDRIEIVPDPLLLELTEKVGK